MRDVNGSSFHLLSGPTDWAATLDMAPGGTGYSLSGRQSWRLPATMTATEARARLSATGIASAQPAWPIVVDAFGGIARLAAGGTGVETLDAGAWTKMTDIDGNVLAPKAGCHFIDMALGGSRLALLATDGTHDYLQLFDLRQRWALDTALNPSLPLTFDPSGTAVAAANEGQIFILVSGGLAICEGGPILEFLAPPNRLPPVFAPVAANPDPLRVTKIIGNRPAGSALGMAVDSGRVAILLDAGSLPQILAVLDRVSGLWMSIPIAATDGTPLPYMTGVGLLADSMVALIAPNPPAPGGAQPLPANVTVGPADCAVVTLVAPGGTPPSGGVTLAAWRYPMRDQAAPRFAAIPGPEVYYLGGPGPGPVPPGQLQPRRLLRLPYPAYVTAGAMGGFGIAGNDPDQTWHRLYAEALLPSGTSLTIWARVAEEPLLAADQAAIAKDRAAADTIDLTADQAALAADQAAMMAIILNAPPGTSRIDAPTATATAAATGISAPSAALLSALTQAPFHLQPPLAASGIASELPFHPGLAALNNTQGELYELLLQRTLGENRRLVGGWLDLVVVARGDGRHSPCLHAVRVYTPRFCYQDNYLPVLFHQTSIPDDSPQTTNHAKMVQSAAASPPDFRERLLANLEGMLTPIENRVAAAEYLLDPYATPAAMLPWLGSYLGLTVDPGWPVPRQRRALAMAGRQLRERGTYRGVCLAVDIATDGAVARGEVVLLETHRLRRTNATILGIPLGDENVLTRDGVDSGNSIVGDTLVLSAQRAIDVLALLAPSAVDPNDAAQVARFLDEYADRVQLAVLLQGPSAAALQKPVATVLQAELPAQINFRIVMTDQRFVIGLSPLLDVDTFLDPPVPPALLTLDQSVIGRDTVVRDPAALRQ